LEQVPYIFLVCHPCAPTKLEQYISRQHEHEQVNYEHPDRHDSFLIWNQQKARE